MDEQKVNSVIQAAIAGIVSLLSAFGTFMGVDPAYSSPYMAGLVASGLSGIVAIYFAVKHIREGAAPAA